MARQLASLCGKACARKPEVSASGFVRLLSYDDRVDEKPWPRVRSVQQEQIPGEKPKRSPDAPRETVEHAVSARDGVKELKDLPLNEEKQRKMQVDKKVAEASPHATEVLHGRADRLREHPSLYMHAVDKGDHEASNVEMAKDWATHLVESVAETIHGGTERAAAELRRKFGSPGQKKQDEQRPSQPGMDKEDVSQQLDVHRPAKVDKEEEEKRRARMASKDENAL
ncbi:hypothetical protein DUNSADRAFT_223 [Dunaliella salina]|uniref:Uncharacterized protein n=1 Tax=Dunaliella salina TaxID=3046 RepID=A0ABQ7GYI5_DUNSA|nr:hypothetical protein DUNSADRAFT_223 [Dunaliella salina]|eukprot:KAF5839669.1 hypothetical protein DUNSADRAFT_223 [Dunaliella salina]